MEELHSTKLEIEPEYYTLSRSEWEQIETVRDAGNRLLNNIQQIDNSGMIGVSPEEIIDGHHRKFGIKVTYRIDWHDNTVISSPNISYEELQSISQIRQQVQ
jgi:hypothetical protein